MKIYHVFLLVVEKLIEAINNDIKVAGNQLDKSELATYFTDKFFAATNEDNPHQLSNGN